MKGKTTIAIMLVLVLSLTVSTMVALAGSMDEGDNYDEDFTCGWATLPPVIDGDIDINEWNDAVVTDIEYTVDDFVNATNETIYLYFMNDADWLYFAIDICFMNGTQEDGLEMAFDEDDDDEFEYDWDDGNEQWIYAYSGTEGGFFSHGGDMELKSKEVGGETFGTGTPVATPLEFDEGTFNASAYSNKPFLWAVGIDDTENSDTNHKIWEFAIPLANMQNGDMELGDTFRYGIYGESEFEEEWSYPIEADLEGEDSSEWAEITLNSTGTVAPAEGWGSIEYAMLLVGIGLIMMVIALLGFNQLVLDQIAKGKEKLVMLFMGVTALIIALGILEWYYEWLGLLGLY